MIWPIVFSIFRHMVDLDRQGQLKNNVAFGDPHVISSQSIDHDMDGVRDYIVRLLHEYSARASIQIPYNTG